MRVWAVNGTSTAPAVVGTAQAELLGGELDDRATLRRLVGERRQQRRLGEVVLGRRRGPG